jgi:hypothetical protein
MAQAVELEMMFRALIGTLMFRFATIATLILLVMWLVRFLKFWIDDKVVEEEQHKPKEEIINVSKIYSGKK